MYTPFSIQGSTLVYQAFGETLTIAPWGEESLRVRASMAGCTPLDNDFALTEPIPPAAGVEITLPDGDGIGDGSAVITHGRLSCHVTWEGVLTFKNRQGKTLLAEFSRNRRDVRSHNASALEIQARAFRPLLGGDYELTARFESDPDEKLYGMGQYQQSLLNLKGTTLELAHRNSQATVPFAVSSLGYGFLWNNPAVGEVSFARNVTLWRAQSTKVLDYWITAGDTPSAILSNYTAVTGRPPMMPEYGLGFWQCKLRYETQDQVMAVAREHKRRGLPIDVIVIDFMHWPKQGEWKFDLNCFPDPEGMIRELDELGIALMVSVWPTVDKRSENYEEMRRRGLLVRAERGVQTAMEFMGTTMFYDPTNPESRAFVWGKAKQNYFDKGVKIFWLDEAEPEYAVYDFDNYRYFLGPNLQIGNLYPVMYAQTFFDGMREARATGADPAPAVVNLLRCAWAGSQKYGALVWSGDIASSFEVFRRQLCAGLNMGMAGIPWWTTDIGGFHGGNPGDPAFRELFARWFAWGALCPVMRLHGDREPHGQPILPGYLPSGADNEVWSYGDEVYAICEKYLWLREALRPYVRGQMLRTHETGEPVMRPLLYDFPGDETAWSVEDQYMFGPDYLVAPVMEAGSDSRRVYLPAGARWARLDVDGAAQVHAESGAQACGLAPQASGSTAGQTGDTAAAGRVAGLTAAQACGVSGAAGTSLPTLGDTLDGGQWVEVATPLDVIPVFVRR